MGWFASADAPAQAPAARAEAADAAQFDRLIEQVERGDEVVGSPQQVRTLVQRLDGLRPRNDALRELRLRGFRCDYDDLGPPASGLAFARAGRVDAQRLGDVGSQIRFGLCEAGYIDGSGRIAQSMAPIETALALARMHGDPRLLAQSISHRGSVRSLLGEQAAALIDFLETERVYSRAGLKKEAEASLQNIAMAYRRMGDLGQAHEYLRQSMAFAEREGDWIALTAALMQTAFVHEDSGRYDDALATETRALQIATANGLEYEAAAAHLAIASTQVKRGDHDAATRAIAAARSGFDRLGDRSNEGMLQLLVGQVHAGRNDHGNALVHFDASSRAFDADPNLRYQVELYAARALSQEALGDYRAALNDLKLERSGRRKLSDDTRTQQSLLLQYQFDTARRDVENARLQAEQRSQRQKLDAVERANRWQAAALLSGGLLVALLLFLLMRQLQRVRRINALALTDALTGVANRRHIENAASDAVAQARSSGHPLAVLTFDLDWFKRINDGHGHGRGDQVLVRVARACEGVLREHDLLGRIGGEEFIVLLPDTSRDAALHIAERLRESVENLGLFDIAPDLRVTISLGLAMLRKEDDGLHDVIDRADAALYRAKENGRNRIEVDGESRGRELPHVRVAAPANRGLASEAEGR